MEKAKVPLYRVQRSCELAAQPSLRCLRVSKVGWATGLFRFAMDLARVVGGGATGAGVLVDGVARDLALPLEDEGVAGIEACPLTLVCCFLGGMLARGGREEEATTSRDATEGD